MKMETGTLSVLRRLVLLLGRKSGSATGGLPFCSHGSHRSESYHFHPFDGTARSRPLPARGCCESFLKSSDSFGNGRESTA